jgi:folate-binding protein YgfZ
MARLSPLNPAHERAGAVLAPYGPEGNGIPVVQVCSGIDREYAAIRRAAAVLDLPQRAAVEVTGSDRLSFLNRMLTQELKGLEGTGRAPYSVRRSFWLNRKGRIDADLTVIGLPDRVILEMDAHAAARTVEGLSSYIIADDVQVRSLGDDVHRLSLHGPHSAAILAAVAAPAGGSPAVTDLGPGQAGLYADGSVLVWRSDSTGEAGVEVMLPTAAAADVYLQLAEPAEALVGARDRPGRAIERQGGGDRSQGRPGISAAHRAVRAGWHAFNIARVEAGTPLYYLDFGPDSLPHETGEETLHDRVSFRKGCYLGQEIVARMQSLGHPKQRLVALDFPDITANGPETEAPQPVTGSRITLAADPVADAIGVVTSSVISPMLGGRPVCFAMVKHKHAAPGTTVHVMLETGEHVPAVVRPSLVYWSRPREPGTRND